ncbi:aminobenzoyl-glutamate utilization protein B [Altererythrobacter atlanticus]|uniref:p-aminobenzoyl-glutamate hydrolase subunit B n=1 Tax=Croceibacterium atlanticum TaxID=1267766 RepID=A0A0F7KU17_9SPHN|nr:peptidase dimerization domain-containing protein [Croceibacterium atlanticum]AKH43858.1 p-aminobenzoyl-glutamate hydrolase subunit B [Croceibacterium atlanticum]MBB5733692.1 aminobenzoyl-glutamate utilization protein B [Croceibacterium atlanticum]
MRKFGNGALTAVAAIAMLGAAPTRAEAPAAYKEAAASGVDARAKLVQEMVDSIFSFAEPGFQEFRTQEYVTAILEENGFTIEKGVAGIPSAWTATWSNGEGPKIALGSDVDGLLGLSQKPGVAEITPLVKGAPGHGEGHNSGIPAMVAAALAVKDVMEAEGITGTLMIWPGIAEELLATKAYYVREGIFDGFDACIFAHVSPAFGTAYGQSQSTGMVSVEYTFQGKTSHGAGAPWAGRSALDGVELMDVAWNFRREHLPLTQRSHYVITNGGGQPNIVPGEASVWYYFRDVSFDGIRTLFETGNTIAEAAAEMTGTTMTRRTLGYAAPQWPNKPIAEAAYKNIQAVGMPEWSAEDQAFVRRLQEANNRELMPLATEVAPLGVPSGNPPMGGPSDDVGDIMWTLPTITIGYPSQAPNVIFHNVLAAMAMATPIAHKGAVAGAKAVAMTTLDLLTTPELLAEAKKYQQEVQFAEQSYDPLITAEDQPAIDLNAEIMRELRPQMEEYYYDPARYDSYLDQLGISYPEGE